MPPVTAPTSPVSSGPSDSRAAQPGCAGDPSGRLRPGRRAAADRGGAAGVRRALRRARRHPARARDVRPADRQLLRGLPRRRGRSRLGRVAAPPVSRPSAPRTAPRSSGCTSRRPPAGTASPGGMLAHLEAHRRGRRRRGDGAGDRDAAARGDRALRVRRATRRSRASATTGTRRSPGASASCCRLRAGGRGGRLGAVSPAERRPSPTACGPPRGGRRRGWWRTVTARMPTTTAERGQGRDLRHRGPAQVAPVQRQLHADEAQDRGQAVAEVAQLRQRALEHEVERPQAEQGEGVGGEDQVGVAGDAVDRRHRVDREDDVGGQHRQRRPGRAGSAPARPPRRR